MSRLAKTPLVVPKNVKIAFDANKVNVEGPKGKLTLDIPSGIVLEKKDEQIFINRLNDLEQSKANHGTVKRLINNMIIGVVNGHKKSLEIQGVGFRAQIQGSKLILNLGFSHPAEFEISKDVKVVSAKPTEISVEGIDKALVGQVAAQIRAFKPPEPYKGKGIRYVGEHVRRKQGKAVTK